ncbi:MAG: magnesium transporter CorA family protein [Xanthomonadales bacterium]|nr:magnesium transporter CorA family protein [Xanthomonadales bacterium]
MLSSYIARDGRVEVADTIAALHDADLVWVDLLDPSAEERLAVEQRFGLAVPSQAEMGEIEPSNRLYEEDGALFMTATLVAHVETGSPRSAPVTFILGEGQLITLRYIDPKSFRTYAGHLHKARLADKRPVGVFTGLLETVVARQADILERISLDADQISAHVFRPGEVQQAKPPAELLKDIGRCGELTSRLREAVVSTIRLLTWFGHPENGYQKDPGVRERIKSLGRDLASLADFANYQSNKVQFLLDATLGRINIEQTNIIKIFSVAAAAFLPPTLIASIYGMNFEVMPELGWRFGYPLALVAMVLSAVLPLWYFKRRGWL